MIPRYSRPEMASIWSEESKFQIWFEIEAHACDAQAKLGVIPAEAATTIWQRGAFEIDRINEIERETKHDVIAFLTNLAEHIGEDARFVHQGMTSSDVLDTTLSVQLVRATDLMLAELDRLLAGLDKRAHEHKRTATIGRSHGIHAEPTTFGLKMALMFDEFGRAERRLKDIRKQVAVGKLSGAVGTNAHLSPKVEAAVCRRLGLKPAPIATQVVQRDIHAEFMTVIALVGASIERWATEFRHLQRTEVLEAEEFFSKGQKGSSAMPHKRNPITGERLTGLARVLRGNALAALENVALWHERDISHSSVERVIFPDSCTLLDYMLNKLSDLTDGLIVYPANMERNMQLSLGMWHSQTVLLALIQKGLTREASYALVQRNAMETWKSKHAGDTGADFKKQLLKDPEVAKHFKKGELEKLCSTNFHYRQIKSRFKKLGIV